MLDKMSPVLSETYDLPYRDNIKLPIIEMIIATDTP